jgi:phosphoribosylamine--glycine ligase
MNGFDDMGQVENCFVYHAGTKLSDNGEFLTNGGRVIGVTAKGNDLREALDIAYKGVEGISFEGAHYRKDIGHKALNS